jgi:hypothetical protein
VSWLSCCCTRCRVDPPCCRSRRRRHYGVRADSHSCCSGRLHPFDARSVSPNHTPAAVRHSHCRSCAALADTCGVSMLSHQTSFSLRVIDESCLIPDAGMRQRCSRCTLLVQRMEREQEPTSWAGAASHIVLSAVEPMWRRDHLSLMALLRTMGHPRRRAAAHTREPKLCGCSHAMTLTDSVESVRRSSYGEQEQHGTADYGPRNRDDP